MCQHDLDRLAESGDHYIAYSESMQNYLNSISDSGNELAFLVDHFSDWFDQGKSGADYADYLVQLAQDKFYDRNNGTLPEFYILNELSPGKFFSNKPGYRQYAVDVVKQLSHVHGIKPILCSPALLINPKKYPDKIYKILAKYSYIGVEAYLDSRLVVKQGLSFSWVFKTYNKGIQSYVNAGVPRSRIVFIEDYASTGPSTKWGRGGVSLDHWKTIIAMRNQAAKKLKVAGFMSYGWYLNDFSEQGNVDPADVRDELYDAYNTGVADLP